MIKCILTSLILMLLSGCTSLLKVPPTNQARPLTEDKVAKEEVKKQVEPQAIPVQNKLDPAPDDPFYRPIDPQQKAAPIAITGSLFNSDTSHSLYSYSAPYTIGDTITVILKENASASKSASSTLANNDNYTLDPITIPGGELSVNGKTVELGLNKTLGFDGESGADQKHSLSARITVSVIDVLNNGNLNVRGEKWLELNNGKEYMRFTGVIRPLDITEDNTIESAQIADSRITFSATGDHAKVQKQGWLSSLLSGSL